MWEHSSHLPVRFSDGSELQSEAESGAAPSLVLVLAHLQLRSLREGVSLASLALAEAAEVEEAAFVGVVDGKPSLIQTFDSPSPSPTPSPRRLPKTSSLPGSGQVRNPNGTFGANQEV